MNLYIFSKKGRGAAFGIGTYIRELTSVLKDSEIRICVIHLLSDKVQIQKEEIEGVLHWYLPVPISKQWSFLDQEQRALYFHNIVYLLQLHIKDRKDLVFHLNYYQNENLADELKGAFDCKIVSVTHFSDWASAIYDNPQRLRAILRKERPDVWGEDVREAFEEERADYIKMDRVVSLSNYMRNLLCLDYGLNPTKITVIPNGLSDKVDLSVERNLLREKWHIRFDERIILFVGRVDEIKGARFLIRAFHEVLKSCPNCRLVIVGDGNYDRVFKEAKKSCVQITFTGFLEREELYEMYRIADIGVVPSLFEPFGYVPVEMMMHELPIVATATSGLNEVVDESCGLKIPLAVSPDSVEIDTELLAEKIVYLLQHPMEAARLGKNGRKRYLEKYSSQVFGRNMIAFYNSQFS